MEIIIGLLALNAGLINEKLFVALVIMALITSVVSGSMIQYILQLKKRVHVSDFPALKALNSQLKGKEPQVITQEVVQ